MAKAFEYAPWPDGKGNGVWGASSVREMAEVRKEAQGQGKKCYFGRMAELLGEKNAEMEAGHPDRKMKARCVFLGDRVTDEGYV